MTTNPMFSLQGKVALVTGSHRGIGFAIAREMARAGAKVVISSLDAPGCETALNELRGEGLEAAAIPCDVGDDDALDQLVAGARARFGRIDILVANAGVNPHFGPLASAADEQYDAIMRVNLRATMRLCNLVIPELAARSDGAVILTASISSVRGNKSIGLYGLSKAAIAQLARNLAVEWGPSNVRVNAISPGLIRTEFAAPILGAPEALGKRIAQTPLRRVGETDDIAGVAVFLASRAGAFVTGQNLIVDGGTTISD